MDNNEFNKLIQQTENKHRRDNLKAAITRHGGIVKINQTAALADIQSYLLTDSSARHSYTEKLKMQAVMQRITTSIEEDLAARGYTSVFNILLDMAIGDDENQIKLKSHYIDRIEISIAQTYYPQLIGLIESDELLVADKNGVSCKYALLKQAPSEIEIPDFLTMPEAITRFSTKFWQQFNVLKDFFVHFEIEEKTNTKRQQTGTVGVSPEKIKAMEAARDIAKKLWATEEHKNKRISEMADEVYSELWSDFKDHLPDKKRINNWIRSVAPEHAKKGGRPKK